MKCEPHINTNTARFLLHRVIFPKELVFGRTSVVLAIVINTVLRVLFLFIYLQI